MHFVVVIKNSNEKALREMQTLRAGCSKAEPKNFAHCRPLPGEQDGQNLISWRRSLQTLQTQFGEDRCMQFQVILVTDTHTNKPTHPQTGPITIHCAAKLSVQCNYTNPITATTTCNWNSQKTIMFTFTWISCN